MYFASMVLFSSIVSSFKSIKHRGALRSSLGASSFSSKDHQRKSLEIESRKLDMLQLADQLTRTENASTEAAKLAYQFAVLQEETRKNKSALLFAALNSFLILGFIGCVVHYVCDKLIGKKSEFHTTLKVISWTQIYLTVSKIGVSAYSLIGRIFRIARPLQ